MARVLTPVNVNAEKAVYELAVNAPPRPNTRILKTQRFGASSYDEAILARNLTQATGEPDEITALWLVGYFFSKAT